MKECLDDAMRNGPYGKCVYDCDNDVCEIDFVTKPLEENAEESEIESTV